MIKKLLFTGLIFFQIIAFAQEDAWVFLNAKNNVSNALGAAAAASVLGLGLTEIAAGLEAFKPCPGRMELLELPGDIVVLEDSYNANPLSVHAALDALYLDPPLCRGLIPQDRAAEWEGLDFHPAARKYIFHSDD